MVYTTEGGTTFTEQDGQITISRDDPAESVTVPVDDLEEFFEDYFGDGDDGDDPEAS